jgi:hypothetical protein
LHCDAEAFLSIDAGKTPAGHEEVRNSSDLPLKRAAVIASLIQPAVLRR